MVRFRSEYLSMIRWSWLAFEIEILKSRSVTLFCLFKSAILFKLTVLNQCINIIHNYSNEMTYFSNSISLYGIYILEPPYQKLSHISHLHNDAIISCYLSITLPKRTVEIPDIRILLAEASSPSFGGMESPLVMQLSKLPLDNECRRFRGSFLHILNAWRLFNCVYAVCNGRWAEWLN